MDLLKFLKFMVEKGGSDLHLRVGSPPIVRVDEKLVPTNSPALTSHDVESIAFSLMNEDQKKIFKEKFECDLSYAVSGLARFRVNIFMQRGTISIVMRYVPTRIPSFEELGLPPVIKKIADNPRGLILVTGTTGCGKSTTLAAMIDHINSTRSCHIITIEDPIEFLHQDKIGIISQRELDLDTLDYKEALKHIVRQDPDVILIGEMRDIETMAAALTAAQTGHLVLSTIHTIDAIQTVTRIVDLFPPHQQNQIRVQLADTLRGVISQRLLIRAEGKGLIPAVEVLVVTALIKKYIEENKIGEIMDAMRQGKYYGMQTFNQSLIDLYNKKLITLEGGLSAATNPEELMLNIRGIESGTSTSEV